MNFTENYESYIKNTEIYQKVKYLDNIIDKLKRIKGYGECPYCCSKLDVNAIREELNTIQKLRYELQAEYELETKKRIEQQHELALIRRREEEKFKKICDQLKPILMPKIRKIVKSILNDYTQPITLPNISEEQKKPWDWLMEHYMDDDGEKEEFMTDKRLYFYQYQS